MSERENMEQEIINLTWDLFSSVSPIGDWKIIKIYEARMKRLSDPYDFDELVEKRQAARDRINELQELIKRGDDK